MKDHAQRCAEYVYIVDLFFNLNFVLNYVSSNGLEMALFWKISPPQCERACGGPKLKVFFW